MSYHYDEQCCLTDPGHQILDADYYIASGNSTPPIEVTAIMLDDGVIELRWNGSVLRGGTTGRSSSPRRCATGGGAADWVPERQLVIVPTLGVGNRHAMFSVGFLDERTPCLDDAFAHNRIPHTTSTKGDSDDIRQQFSGRPDLAA